MSALDFHSFSVDGPGDRGADLICERDGERWVVQTKWKKSGVVPEHAVDEAIEGYSQFNAHKCIVATNSTFSNKALRKTSSYQQFGVEIDCWDGQAIRDFSKQAPAIKGRTLREYQSEAAHKIISDLEIRARALLYMATGLGKTVIAGAVLKYFMRTGKARQVLVVAHMIDLIEQLQQALWKDIPLDVPTQIVDGSNKPKSLDGVTFATNASIIDYIDAGYRPDLVIIDECHHVGEKNIFRNIVTALEDRYIVGVTATPWRGDRFSVERIFGSPSYTCGIEDGMKKGFLAPVDYRLFCDNIDWDLVPQLSENEYTIKDLNKRLFIPTRDNKIIEDLLNAWRELKQPKAIIFCQSIKHAESLLDGMKKFDCWAGATVLHSELSAHERKVALLKFRGSECDALVAVDILNEGVDVPDVNIICFARVTHSRKIFVQQLGRGLRLSPEKNKVLVLDFAADVRRLASLSVMSRNLRSEGLEVLDNYRNTISFSDTRARSLVDEWILDAADLETESDEAKLQFPEYKD
jgi:superfamily II DNA or RNA helicase